MRIFLMVAAIVVGIANATLYSFIGNNTFDNLFEWQRDPWSLYLLYTFTAVFVGLMISGILLRFAEDVLRETFFARYGLMVLTICAGGAVLAVFLTTITYLFDPDAVVPSRVSETSYTLAMVTVPGATLGAIEGIVLAFPLAWLLGLFKKRPAEAERLRRGGTLRPSGFGCQHGACGRLVSTLRLAPSLVSTLRH